MNRDQQRLLSKAKLAMLRQLPYYGTYCIGMEHVESHGIPTACTDGTRFTINPFWMLGGDTRDGITHGLRPLGEVIFIETHEVMHNTLKHMLRFGWRHQQLANIAADHVVNLLLIEGKVGTIPQPWPEERADWVFHADPRFQGMSFEKVYDVLEGEWRAQGGGDRFRSGGIIIDLRRSGIGDFEAPLRLTDADRAALERLLDSRTSTAAAAAKSQGKLPASIARLIETALRPKIDWRERLRQFVGKTIPSDYSWARPHRRFLGALDLYLPHVEKSGVGEIAYAFDTSGSMTYTGPTSEGAQLFAECKAIYQDTQPERLHIFYCDAAVHGHEIFEPGDDPEMKRLIPKGGGGTNFRPLFAEIERQRLPLQCLVFGTDGYAEFPDKAPDYPVLWVCTTDVRFPWGETIRMER